MVAFKKINQPFEQELVLQIAAIAKAIVCFFLPILFFGRIQLTQTTFENPAQPSTFIMVLRKYLQGALIESIEQVENDRIVEMTVSNKNEIGDHIQATFDYRNYGKHSNILLVDKSSHKILEVIKHVGFSQNSYRTLLPGSTYIAPPSTEALNPLQSRTKNSLKSCKHRKRQLKIFKASFKVWDAIRQMNWKAYLLVKNRLLSVTFQSRNQAMLNRDFLQSVPFENQMGEPFASLSDLLDTYYKDKAERDRQTTSQ